MPSQLQLLPDDATDARDCRWLEDLLRVHKGWMNAAQILQIVGVEIAVGSARGDAAKRQLRQLANASPWLISGQRGYKHLEHATAEEVNHFVNWMESQASQMTRRAELIRRNAHRIFG
jgi:hypothetical protein